MTKMVDVFGKLTFWKWTFLQVIPCDLSAQAFLVAASAVESKKVLYLTPGQSAGTPGT